MTAVDDQRTLFLANRKAGLDVREYDDMIRFENEWVSSLFRQFAASERGEKNFQGFSAQINALIERQKGELPSSAKFLAYDANRNQFKVLVEQFAVDGLTEAQSFLPILPRLPYEVQMPIMRVLIDEFGCGNLDRMHSHLYCELLQELGSSTDLNFFVANTATEVFEFVNIFHWMTKRSERVEYFLGALTWFESVVPDFFAPYIDACNRLGIQAHHYFSEHIHIDTFHARSALLACRKAAMHIEGFDLDLAFQGAQLMEFVTDRAFEAAILRSRAAKLAA